MSIRISIIGFGAVGQGVADALMRTDYPIEVVAIADSRGAVVNAAGIDLASALQRKRGTGTVAVAATVADMDGGAVADAAGMTALDVIAGVDHEIMVEATSTDIITGGIGLSHIRGAFESGRHVVTSNKGPLVVAYSELCGLARKHDRHFRFEATVGGSMPAINLSNEALAGNRIISIEGVLNGTCNYILTRMDDEGVSYEHVLGEAQELGIAEADPSADVDGIDTAAKIVILANSVFGMDAGYDDVDVTGITKITPESFKLAKEEGHTIKLIGEIQDGVLKVAPKMVPRNHPLSIGGTFNLASIQTELAGRITIGGIGAGSVETASAILSDILWIEQAIRD
ncbi:MAG: homoserine dehydrogenase [Euryarchaeota archaeon]|nr:homoserine dehydrogenase [Euryarchaeota archaeon]